MLHSFPMTTKELSSRIDGLSGVQKTNTIVSLLGDSKVFAELSKTELELLRQRDLEDEYKLKEGISVAESKGLLSRAGKEPEWIRISVDGKMPGEIYDEIASQVGFEKPGTVLLICGNSGVGKGTLVEELISRTPGAGRWSNGDIFRVFTYFVLAAGDGQSVDPDTVGRTDFDEISSRIIIEEDSDIIVRLPGGDTSLDSIKNGILKETPINRALPSVARYTQGEVIAIVNRYLKLNKSSHLILEGRKETLNYIDADYRVELVLDDKSILGKRRAAQKIASLLDEYKGGDIGIDEFLRTQYK